MRSALRGSSGPAGDAGRRTWTWRGQGSANTGGLDTHVLTRGRQLARRSSVGIVELLPLAVLMALYVWWFATVAVDLLRTYQQPAYDLALYDQGIWLLSRFHAPFMTVMGMDMFGTHTVFIFALLVPLYWIYPHTSALLVIQATTLALGAVPMYLLAKRWLRSPVLATLMAAAYLLNPAIQLGNLNQFHVEAFEAPLLVCAVYAAVVWRPRPLVVTVILLLLCKQDTALFVLPLGMWVWFRRDRRLGGITMVSALGFGLIENLVIIPVLLNGIPVTYGSWWPFGTFSDTVRTAVRKPGRFWSFATSQGRPFYVWQMWFSAGLACVAAPGLLAVALPELIADTLSSNPYLHQIVQHYSMPVAAVLLCATVVGVGRLSSARRRYIAVVGVTICALWSCILWGAAPFSNNKVVPPNPNAPSVVATARLLTLIPATAVVSAAQNFVPNLDHRVGIYMFPNPFYQSYYGNPKYDGTRLPAASKVQYIVLPSCIQCNPNLGTSDEKVFAGIAPQFKVVAQASGVVLYKRRSPA